MEAKNKQNEESRLFALAGRAKTFFKFIEEAKPGDEGLILIVRPTKKTEKRFRKIYAANGICCRPPYALATALYGDPDIWTLPASATVQLVFPFSGDLTYGDLYEFAYRPGSAELDAVMLKCVEKECVVPYALINIPHDSEPREIPDELQAAEALPTWMQNAICYMIHKSKRDGGFFADCAAEAAATLQARAAGR